MALIESNSLDRKQRQLYARYFGGPQQGLGPPCEVPHEKWTPG